VSRTRTKSSRWNALGRLLHRAAARLYDAKNFVLRPRVTGAIVLVRVGGDLLLVRSSYRPWYTVPGGRVQRREEPLLAARRELFEEVGLAAEPLALRPLGEFVVHHSHIEDHVHAFELRLEARPPLRIDSREIVWAGFHAEGALGELRLWPVLEVVLGRPYSTIS
jgi:8-oxo-dGTP pyrophosphatase MutT (NUDIX family)